MMVLQLTILVVLPASLQWVGTKHCFDFLVSAAMLSVHPVVLAFIAECRAVLGDGLLAIPARTHACLEQNR